MLVKMQNSKGSTYLESLNSKSLLRELQLKRLDQEALEFPLFIQLQEQEPINSQVDFLLNTKREQTKQRQLHSPNHREYLMVESISKNKQFSRSLLLLKQLKQILSEIFILIKLQGISMLIWLQQPNVLSLKQKKLQNQDNLILILFTFLRYLQIEFLSLIPIVLGQKKEYKN